MISSQIDYRKCVKNNILICLIIVIVIDVIIDGNHIKTRCPKLRTLIYILYKSHNNKMTETKNTFIAQTAKQCNFCGKMYNKKRGPGVIYAVNEKVSCSDILCSGKCLKGYIDMIEHVDGIGCLVCGIKKKEDRFLIEIVREGAGSSLALVCSIPCRIKCRKLFPHKRCFGCNKDITNDAFKCDSCLFVMYCSKKCQTANWKVHRQQCNWLRNGRIQLNPGDEKHICTNCLKQTCKKLSRCSRCKIAHYCSKECQKDHWKNGHKKQCKPTNVVKN